MLRSLKAIRKETSIVAMILGWSTPNPRFGAPVELSGRDTSSLLDLIGIGKTLTSQGITAEEPPPTFLQVQPAGSFRDEDVVETGMLNHPGAGLGTVMAGEVVGDDEDVAAGIVGFDSSQQGDVVGRVARSGTARQLLAITHAQRSIDPGLLRPATVIQQRFDAMPSGRPAGCGREGAGNYWPEFIGADGRRPLGRFSVVADDLCSFGTKSGSSLVPQLWVWRQRTPSRR